MKMRGFEAKRARKFTRTSPPEHYHGISSPYGFCAPCLSRTWSQSGPTSSSQQGGRFACVPRIGLQTPCVGLSPSTVSSADRCEEWLKKRGPSVFPISKPYSETPSICPEHCWLSRANVRLNIAIPILFQKNPRAHKHKIGTPPPPRKPISPPPPKKRNFMGMEVFLRKERILSRRPCNWRGHFRPRIAGKTFYGHESGRA